ncbi:ATP-binding protein [Maribacter sp. 2304DJ31-5]|uniref:ATP-binding protein n=1 Tax=Maribacter sp. 2304DJ31-5 TaxID=3386273 RepID=UPI0039BC5B73
MNLTLPIPTDEEERLQKLYNYNILDTEAEDMFDDLTGMVSKLLEVPICLISLVDVDRQWFKSKQGLGVSETPRPNSFCQYVIMTDDLFEVKDTLVDERFKDTHIVTSNPDMRFYIGAPLTDEEGSAIGALCAIDSKPRKITNDQRDSLRSISRTAMQLIKLRREKLEAEKLSLVKDEFLSNMSHEIRTPLNAIIGFNDLLKKTALTKEQADYLNTIQVSSQNLKVIINDILDVAKLESGNIDLEKKAISLSDLMQHVVRLQAPLAKERGIKLLYSFDHEIPDYVVGDETRLTQIFINLVGNAIKFTNEGFVELRAMAIAQEKEKVTVQFSVKDTGIGIPKEKLDTIFERFTQAETSTTRVFGGTGLGLSIVNMLVNLYEGEITVESERDKGSEFKFKISFAITEKEETPQLFTAERKENQEAFKGISVLLVEDNVHNQLLAKNYFKRWGSDIVIAENGKEALDFIGKNTFDVILMDLQMPVMDGFETTEQIRQNLKLTIPIIGCSAHSLVGEKEKCLAVGMNDYIAKPYTEEELIQTTLSYCDKPSNNTNEEVELSDLQFDDFETLIKDMVEQEGADFVESIKSHFQKRTPKDIKEIQFAMTENDLGALQEKSHLISGTLGVFGFDKGRELSSSLENRAKKGDAQNAMELGEQLVSYLNRALREMH